MAQKLKEGNGEFSSSDLLLFYLLLAFSEEVRVSMQPLVKECILTFTQQSTPLSTEQSLLIDNIQQLIEPPVKQQGAHSSMLPDTLAERLYTLRRERQLTGGQVGEIIAACIDLRKISEKKQKALLESTSTYCRNVQDVSWSLFNQPLNFTDEALFLLIERLSDPDVMVCAMAVRLLRSAKTLVPEMREKVMQKITIVLADVIATSHSTPYSERIDDILFETLKGLAE
jgi:hypothetical protein